MFKLRKGLLSFYKGLLAYSILLGDVEVLSHLHEPLDATIRISPATQTMQINLADKQAHHAAGLEPPVCLEKIQVITEDKFVRLRSTEPISEVIIELLIQIKDNDLTSMQPVTLLIDPLNEKNVMLQKIESLEKEVKALKEKSYKHVVYQPPRDYSVQTFATLWQGLDCKYWVLNMAVIGYFFCATLSP